MPAKWRTEKTGYQPDVIISEFAKSRTTNSEGRVSFTDFRFYEQVAALATMLELGQVSDSDAYSIVQKALFSAAKSERFDSTAVLAEANKLLAEHHRKPQKEYCLLTSLSLDTAACPPRLQFLGTRFLFKGDFRRFRKPRASILEEAKHNFDIELPRNYLLVLSKALGRSPEEAVENGLRTFDLLRAVWNFMLNSSESMRMSSGRRQAVNKIHSGPVHTLHNTDGSSAYDGWWYDPQYSGPVPLFRKRDKTARLGAFQRKVWRLLRKHPYRGALEAALIRYGRAMDLRDWESCYLQLWAVLEQLTNTGSGGYGITVKRASALYENGEYARQQLLHLRERRNLSVHEGKEHRDAETLMYQIKGYVEALLWFQLRAGRQFASIQDVGAFLDLPWSKVELSKRLEAIKYALKLRFT